jgi:threonine dehydrogenase-like Zn-dependent dehydrogenase
MACTMHALRLAGPQSAEQALIIGAGSMGLLFIAALGATGCRPLGVIEKQPHRLERAGRFGCTHPMYADRADPDTIRNTFPPHGPDLVVECTGRREGWDAAFEYVRPGGRVVLFGGLPADTQWSIDAAKLHYQQIAIISPFHYTTADVQAAFQFLIDRHVPADALITDHLPLDRIEEAFQRMADGQALKVALYPAGVPGDAS